VPAEHGAPAPDFLSYVLVLEELSRADAGVGVTVAVHTSAGTLPLLAHGTAEQVDRYVPALAAGEELAAFALTSRARDRTRARCAQRANDSRISGQKQWITNGSHASTFIVFAREQDAISAFVVRAGAPGFSVLREEDKLG
jgi:alkylation response protein AidB-like acyl-CoA dehydrogenase